MKRALFLGFIALSICMILAFVSIKLQKWWICFGFVMIDDIIKAIDGYHE